MDTLELVNNALVLAGCAPIASLTDDCDEALTAQTLVPFKIRHNISLHPWRFATRAFELAREAEAPAHSIFATASPLPPCERVIAVRINDELAEFERFENSLLTDAQETDRLTAELLVVPEIEHCPTYFTGIVVHDLAAAFAISLAEDEGKANSLARAAGMALTAGKTADSQGRTAPRMPTGRFRAYVGGGTR